MEDDKKIDHRITALEYGHENLNKCVVDLDTKMDKIINNHLPHIQKSIDEQGDKIVREIKDTFVSKERFSPIEKIVYGMVGLVLTAFLVGLIALIIK